MRANLETVALVAIAFVTGLASALFLLPFWIKPFLAAASSNPADWIGFAGNFGAGIMTLVAGVAAWFAVQRQIRAQDRLEEQKLQRLAEERETEQAEAKFAARLVITQTIHAAAAVSSLTKRFLWVAKLPDQDMASMMRAAELSRIRENLEKAIYQLRAAMGHWSVPQAWIGLGIEDRANYLMMTATLHTIMNVHDNPPQGGTVQAAEIMHAGLSRLSTFLRGFDTELADNFEKDSRFVPPSRK